MLLVNHHKTEKLNATLASGLRRWAITMKTKCSQMKHNTLFNLSIVYQERFTDAYNTFKSAIEIVEFLQGEIVSGEKTKRFPSRKMARIQYRFACGFWERTIKAK